MSKLAALTTGMALMALAFAPRAAEVEDGVPVPNPATPEARFSSSGEADRTFVAHNADRARLVAFEAILLTASISSKVQLEPGPDDGDQRPAAKLLEGAFHLVVGSKTVELRLGQSVLSAVNAELMAAKLGDTWIVQAAPEGEAGRVELVPPAPVVSSAPTAGGTPEPNAGEEAEGEVAPAPAPAPAPVLLETGKRYTLKNGKLGKVERRESEFLAKAIDRLTNANAEPPTQGGGATSLVPRAIEDPRDFAVNSAGADAALSDLEIEDIEVDLGCVEICVD